jgi:hypothetical protein
VRSRGVPRCSGTPRWTRSRAASTRRSASRPRTRRRPRWSGTGRDGTDPAVAARLLRLADEHGLDDIAELWADRPACSLPGALWRIYALRAGIRQDPVAMARAFDAGPLRRPVHEAVAGVAEPPGPDEVRALADAVLAGAFTG